MADIPTFNVRGDDGVEYGPVDLTELREWVRENRVGLGTEASRAVGDVRWQPWQQFPELVALLAEVHATGQVMPPLPGAVPVLAPMGRRSAAFLMDLLLAFILVMPPIMVLYWSQPPPLLIQQQEFIRQFYTALMQGVTPPDNLPAFTNVYLYGARLVDFFLPLLYFAGFTAAHGRTPAKSMLHLRVVDAQGRKPTLGMALLRGLILMISVNLWCVPLIYAFFNPQRRALHDVAAGTYVVER